MTVVAKDQKASKEDYGLLEVDLNHVQKIPVSLYLKIDARTVPLQNNDLIISK